MHTKYFLVLLLAIYSQAVFAQKAEKVITFAKVPKTYDYYKEQAELWQKEIRKDKKNEDAWYNYYFANRYAFQHFPGEKKDYVANRKKNDSILGQMKKIFPNSYTYNYILYRENGLNLEYLPNLEKAYKIAPERVEAYTDLVVCYEAMQKLPERDKFLNLLYEKGDPSPGLMNYNYNVMSGLEPNTILLTHGDNDTYPVWMLQAVKGYRKDVKVLNLSVLLVDVYRNKVLTDLGVDTSGLQVPWKWTEENLENYRVKLIQRLAANSNKYPVAIALTSGHEFAKELKDKLYLTGLVMKYSPERIDNIAIMKKNFEQNYALDYLKMSFVKNDGYKDIVKRVNENYIVPMINLYEHYKLAGETAKAEEMKMLVQAVGKGSAQEEELKKYFGQN